MTLLLASSPGHAFQYTGPVGPVSADGYIEGGVILRSDRSSPSQNPSGLVDVKLGAEPSHAVRLFLETHTLFGGTPKHAEGFGVFNWSDTFQNISPSLAFEEAHVDVALRHAELSAGLQKFTWGRLDLFQPSEVINPRRYYDPFMTDERDAKIGVPSLQASYFPSAVPALSTATVIWVPVPVPTYFPLPDERWFPGAFAIREAFSIPKGSISTGLPVHNTAVSTSFDVANRVPPHQFDEGAVGMRLAGLHRGIDWALTYYDGMETAPNFDLSTTVRCASSVPEQCGLLTIRRLNARTTLLPRFDRIHQAAGDLAFPLRDFTARAEAAYGIDRRLPRPIEDLTSIDSLRQSLGPSEIRRLVNGLPTGRSVPLNVGNLFVSRDAVQWGMGIDYLYNGWSPLLQVNQTLVLQNHTRLLVANADTRVLLALRKKFLADTLATELFAVQGFPRSYSLGEVRITYNITDDLRVRVGYLLIAGSRNTLIGEYHANDETFIQLRYSY